VCELYSDVSDNSDNESLDSDNDVPTTSLCKQLPSSAAVKQVQKRKKIGNRKALMIKQVMCGVKLIKKTKQ
jgi:hypothetical protein